jgi:hypothetical protein
VAEEEAVSMSSMRRGDQLPFYRFLRTFLAGGAPTAAASLAWHAVEAGTFFTSTLPSLAAGSVCAAEASHARHARAALAPATGPLAA